MEIYIVLLLCCIVVGPIIRGRQQYRLGLKRGREEGWSRCKYEVLDNADNHPRYNSGKVRKDLFTIHSL